MASLIERIQNAWNVFNNRDPTPVFTVGSRDRQDRRRPARGLDRTIVAPILNRIAVDAAGIKIQHVKLDEQDRYKETINSGLNQALNVSANIDQTGRSFLQDVYMSILDDGVVAIVPTDADNVNERDWTLNDASINSLRTARITQWYPKAIEVEIYNEYTGEKVTRKFPKSLCAIVENPFYNVMNAPNSTLQRLRRKLALLDETDERSASGKLDLIIQLPYTTRAPSRKELGEKRREEIEMQLSGTKYGIAYIDSSERIIQLNRAVDNNLTPQIDALTKQLQDQIGVSAEILNGSASEATELNYTNNIIEPLVSALVDELKRKFLTKTARTQRQTIMFFRDPFRLVPVNSIADIADKFTRNEILSSNEVRGLIGFKPSDQAGADELRNKNINQSGEGTFTPEQLGLDGEDADAFDEEEPEEEESEETE